MSSWNKLNSLNTIRSRCVHFPANYRKLFFVTKKNAILHGQHTFRRWFYFLLTLLGSKDSVERAWPSPSNLDTPRPSCQARDAAEKTHVQTLPLSTLASCVFVDWKPCCLGALLMNSCGLCGASARVRPGGRQARYCFPSSQLILGTARLGGLLRVTLLVCGPHFDQQGPERSPTVWISCEL